MRLFLRNLRPTIMSVDAKLSAEKQLRVSIPKHGRREITDLATLAECENSERLTLMRSEGKIALIIQDDDVDTSVFVVKMDDVLDVDGGGTTQEVGFQVVDGSGQAVRIQTLVELAVFDDANIAVPSAAATLNTATEGTIVGGAGTAALKVVTDDLGRFACTLTNPLDTTVYLASCQTFGGAALDCQDVSSVTFA